MRSPRPTCHSIDRAMAGGRTRARAPCRAPRRSPPALPGLEDGALRHPPRVVAVRPVARGEGSRLIGPVDALLPAEHDALALVGPEVERLGRLAEHAVPVLLEMRQAAGL